MTFIEKLTPEHPEEQLSGPVGEKGATGEPGYINDPVRHPLHYTAGGIECIDAIEAALTCQTDPTQAWLTGQVLKYLWRWPLKNGVEDLKKADFYLDRLIAKMEEEKK